MQHYTDLISVIVPAYQAEQTIRRCIESILKQTYEYIEIIIINDGSTDKTGSVCRQLAIQDKRIQYIEQSNRGTAVARNTGLEHSRGSWIGWVDADDWIEPDMYERLITYCHSRDADIGICGLSADFQKHRAKKYRWNASFYTEQKETLRLILTDPVASSSLCNKLWKADLFDGIMFGQDTVCEDVLIIHQLVLQSRFAACLSDCMYHYVQRGSSKSHGTGLRFPADYFHAALERKKTVAGLYPELDTELKRECLIAIALFWSCYILNEKEERRLYSSVCREMRTFSKANYDPDMKDLGTLAKLILPLTLKRGRWSFYIAAFYGWLYRKKRGY